MADYIIALILFAAVQISTPGPANIILMASAARFGARRVMGFLAGVILGKQLIIWPIGFGLAVALDKTPALYTALRWLAVAYMLYLTWKIANLRMRLEEGKQVSAPGFWAGLLVHPINPKAWTLILTAFTHFLPKEGAGLQNTVIVAVSLFLIQLVFQPLWVFFGEYVGRVIADKPFEKYVMWAMAASVVILLFLVLLDGKGSFAH